MSGLISSSKHICTRTWLGCSADGGPPSGESGEWLTPANCRLMSGFFRVGAPTGRLPLHLFSPDGRIHPPPPHLIHTNLINTLTANTWALHQGGSQTQAPLAGRPDGPLMALMAGTSVALLFNAQAALKCVPLLMRQWGTIFPLPRYKSERWLNDTIRLRSDSAPD